MIITKSIHKIATIVIILVSVVSCSRNNERKNAADGDTLSSQQQALVEEGWFVPKTKPSGELSNEYGVKNKYGQQDNYFDIQIGKGCDVAVKIIDAATDKCIRYILVPENTTETIQMIPQGKYYLKLAYGNNWMEYDNGDGTLSGKFTSNVSYGKSIDVFDFGKKNSSDIISYTLHINILNSELKNNFNTTAISEEDFMN